MGKIAGQIDLFNLGMGTVNREEKPWIFTSHKKKN